MINLILAGFGKPLELVSDSIKGNLKVLGVIKDYNRYGRGGEEFDSYLNNKGMPILKFEQLKEVKPNLIFVVNYNKIINIRNIENIFALNLHIGLLPKYEEITLMQLP